MDLHAEKGKEIFICFRDLEKSLEDSTVSVLVRRRMLGAWWCRHPCNVGCCSHTPF